MVGISGGSAMTDLTKITTPYGLLDEATQKALREHALCGKIEVFAENGWQTCRAPFHSWSMMVVRRLKPQPPKPREWWVSGGNCLWNTREEAEYADNHAGNVVHVREVIEP